MKRTDTHPRPTAGCLSVPLFNQRKRSRLPLTSTPVENEFCSAIDFDDQIDLADSSFSSGNAAYAAQNQNQRPSGPRPSAAAAQGGQWNRPMKQQQPPQPSNPPVRHTGPVARGYAPLPHPHKPANTWSQQRAPGRQEAPAPNPPHSHSHSHSHSQGLGQIQIQSGPSYGRGRGLQPGQGRGAATGQQQSRLKPMNHQQLTVQQSFSRQQAQGPTGAMQGASGPSGGPRYCPVPAPAPPAPKPQSQQQAQWQFKVSPHMGQTKNNHNNSHVMQSTPQQAGMGQSLNNSTTDFYGAQTTQPQEVPQSPKTKSESEKSLRILTCVIEGMRHWVQFKNKAPMLFEIFWTKWSAVSPQHPWTPQSLMGSLVPSISSCGQEGMSCNVFTTNMTRNSPSCSVAWSSAAWGTTTSVATSSPASRSASPPATSRRTPRRPSGHRTKRCDRWSSLSMKYDQHQPEH
ncbi:uncharacterized protein LOC134451933 [Engraulis encrasicolus]|uniref:uncharacterized protein LOC134451933 n=1 Tax=Engraulis encrasicolus TaxID=184585 RepID=UPI002FCEEE97